MRDRKIQWSIQMKKTFSCIIMFVLSLATQVQALNLDLDLGDEKNNTNIDKYLDYERQRDKQIDDINERNRKLGIVDSLISNSLNSIMDKYNNDKVYLEFHLGMIAYFNFDRTNLLGSNLGIKYNLYNPKRINNNDLKGDIASLEEILIGNQIELSGENKSKIEAIKTEIDDYDKSIIKRIGVGISMPFLPVLGGGGYPSPADLDAKGIVYWAGLYFFYKDLSLFASVDITDYLTLELGYNIFTFQGFYMGASFDLSSPVNLLFKNFLDYLQHFFGV
jgi:hypothetical protein